MKRALTYCIAIVLACAGRATAADETKPSTSAGSSQASSKPNMIFVLADDLGIDGVSCYGADKHKTPHIDALAKSGTRFQTCYAAPLCGPSRCLLMTGRYAFRTGGLTNQSWRRGGPGASLSRRIPHGPAHEAGRLRHRTGRQVAAGRRVAERLGL